MHDVPSTHALRRLLVIVLAAAGVGTLGMSVQGMAAIDRDLAAAVDTQQEREIKKRDCPRPERHQMTRGSVRKT